MQGVGAVFLEKLLNSDKGKKTTEEYAQLKEYRNKTLQTVLGKVVVKRAYYYDKQTKTGCCPKDQELDIDRLLRN